MSLLFAYYSSLSIHWHFFIYLFFVHLLFSISSGMRFRLALWLVCILDEFLAFRMKVNMPKAHYHHFWGQCFFFALRCVAVCTTQFMCLNILRDNFEQIKTDNHGVCAVNVIWAGGSRYHRWHTTCCALQRSFFVLKILVWFEVWNWNERHSKFGWKWSKHETTHFANIFNMHGPITKAYRPICLLGAFKYHSYWCAEYKIHENCQIQNAEFTICTWWSHGKM